MRLQYLIIGQKSHLREQGSPPARTSHGTERLSPPWAWPLQRDGSSSQDGQPVPRREQGNQVTALHFLRDTTMPHSNEIILAWICWLKCCISLCFRACFLIFSGIQLQSTFYTVSRYSSQVYTAHERNKKLNLPRKTDLKIFKQQSDLKSIFDSKLWSTSTFQMISEILVKQLAGLLRSWINDTSWLCKKQQSPWWILKARQWNRLSLWLPFYLPGTDREKTSQNVASEGLQ